MTARRLAVLLALLALPTVIPMVGLPQVVGTVVWIVEIFVGFVWLMARVFAQLAGPRPAGRDNPFLFFLLHEDRDRMWAEDAARRAEDAARRETGRP